MLIEYKWNNPELQKVWKKLYEGNEFLFPYSSFEYNECVYRYKKLKPSTIFQKDYFYVYFEDSKPLLLIPLSVKKKELFMFGDNISGAGNLDFIYDKEITDEQFAKAISELKEAFKGYMLKLYKINERSRLFQFINNNKEELERNYALTMDMDRVCVKIPFGDSYDEYFAGLSKNCRSNLKKAYNKSTKTNANMHLEVIKGPVGDGNVLSDCMRIYTRRESDRKNRKFDYIAFLKHRYMSALTWAIQELESDYTFCLYLNGKVAAFMSGFLTNFGEIVFPLVAMNDDFAAYAPGKLMISESVKYLQEFDKEVRVLDMSRGDERYKLEMGGIKHYNYRYNFIFK